MPETNEKTAQNNQDLLDELDVTGRFRAPSETGWARRRNIWLERHPFAIGYTAFAALVVLVFASHLTTFAGALLFLYLISDFLTNDLRRYAPFLPKALLFSILYLAVIALFTVLSYKVIPNFIRQLPELAQELQQQAIGQFDYANTRWNLTEYVDPQEVQGAIVTGTTKTLGFLGKYFSSFYKGFIYFLFALVINLLLYHRIDKVDRVFDRKADTLMNFLYTFIKARLKIFYFYFKRVMGGQLIISAINTGISAIVVFALGLPHPIVLLSLVFFCGLFPVVGNLVSNTILTVTAFVTIGLWGALVCLGLLVGVHKLEYFLNSKIIGEIVNLPMVVTLTSLVVCDVLLGIVGLILAIPLVLFIRHELEHVPGLPVRQEDLG